jgi:predicted peptidase
MVSGFDEGKITKNGVTIPYRIFIPENMNKTKKYPLVLHFHGAGSRGSDNKKPLYLAKFLTAKKNQQKHPCIIIVPQCPSGKKWIVHNWSKVKHTFSKEPTPYMACAIKLLEDTIKNYSVDKDRIYVYGQSMGGFATWDIICRKPNFFAAAAPVCGGADVMQMKKICHMPIWVFHGAKDPTVKVQNSRQLVEELKKLKCNIKYTEYPEVKHNAWSYSYTNEFIEWLFSHKKEKNNGK